MATPTDSTLPRSLFVCQVHYSCSDDRAHQMLNSMISALTFSPSTKIFPTATGNLNRRGPGLPGLMNNTPSFSTTVGLCE